MRKLREDAAERGIRYLETLDECPVAPPSSAVERPETLRIPLPAHPTDPREVLRELDEVCFPATVAMAGRRFFGFVIGGALPATLAANWLAGAWDNPTGPYSVTPATVTLEEVALGWLLDMLACQKVPQVLLLPGQRWRALPLWPPPATGFSTTLVGTWRRTV